MPIPSSSNYPSSLDDDATLFKLQDRKSFTLTADITDTSLTLIVNESCAGLTGNFYLALATGELVYVTAVTVGSRAMSLVRGASGTSPAPHLAGEIMKMTVSANFFEQIKKAIVAVETELGINPSAAFSDVGSRFVDAESRIAAHTHTGGANGPVIDAGTVDGIHASATAVANKLLALNSGSKLPASITGDADTVDGLHGADLQKTGYFVLAHGTVRTLAADAFAMVAGQYFYTVDTEAAAAADDLKAITGGATGDVLVLRSVSSARVVSIKTGGNIDVAATVVMDGHTEVSLHFDGTYWRMVGAAPAPAAVAMPATCAYASLGQQATTGGWGVTFANEYYDDLNWHPSGTGSNRITPGVAGWYQAFGHVSVQNPNAAQWVTGEIRLDQISTSILGQGRSYSTGGYAHVFDINTRRFYMTAANWIAMVITTSSVSLDIYEAIMHLEKVS